MKRYQLLSPSRWFHHKIPYPVIPIILGSQPSREGARSRHPIHHYQTSTTRHWAGLGFLFPHHTTSILDRIGFSRFLVILTAPFPDSSSTPTHRPFKTPKLQFSSPFSGSEYDMDWQTTLNRSRGASKMTIPAPYFYSSSMMGAPSGSIA